MIILASQSPRRQQLLESLGLIFRVERPESDELTPDEQNVDEIMKANALAKAESVLLSAKDPNEIIIGADTLVMLDGKALGKPADKSAAAQTLKKLSARTHEVVTGLALVSGRYGKNASVHRSHVTFRQIAPAEIESYCNILEPYDKAGSYAVQGAGALFISRIEGSYTNVMGLPIEGFLKELSALTGRSVFEFFPKRTA